MKRKKQITLLLAFLGLSLIAQMPAPLMASDWEATPLCRYAKQQLEFYRLRGIQAVKLRRQYRSMCGAKASVDSRARRRRSRATRRRARPRSSVSGKPSTSPASPRTRILYTADMAKLSVHPAAVIGEGIASMYQPWKRSWSVPYATYPGNLNVPPSPMDLVCAHRTLPFGSLLRISREGAPPAFCRVLDRGPYGFCRATGDGKKWSRQCKAGYRYMVARKSRTDGYYRGILDATPAVHQLIGSPGFTRVKVELLVLVPRSRAVLRLARQAQARWPEAWPRDVVAWFHPMSQRLLPGKRTRQFGAWRPGGETKKGCGQGHCGLDLFSDLGTTVYSSGPGLAIKLGNWNDPRSGKHIVIKHPGGIMTTYCHLKDIAPWLLKLKERGVRAIKVSGGQEIGTVGRTGVKHAGPHLHYNLQVDGEYVDSEPFLRIANLPSAP